MDKQLFVGDEPRLYLIQPIKNYHIKANGGLWTSTYNNGRSEWIEWCESENFYTTDKLTGWLLTVNKNAKILTIDSYSDLEEVYKEYKYEDTEVPRTSLLDYEKLSVNYDGLHLTSKGQWKTRLTYPLNLYGWDCESTHWFRWVFDKVECIGKIEVAETSF